jgi:raffinose/stachyose/melibiose transport system permease protein
VIDPKTETRPESDKTSASFGGRKVPPGEPRRIGYLYVLPAFLFYFAFVILPMLQTGWLSLFEWDGISAGTWVGFENYRALFEEPRLRGAFVNAGTLILFYSVIPVCLGLFVAAILARGRVRGMVIFRTVFFLPHIIAMVVVAVIWRWIYEPQTGPLNELLRWLGLDGIARPWLGESLTALPALGVAGTWVQFGLCMVLLLAGIQKIPPELYDAARVDGAGPVREFLAVTLPGLRAELAVAVTITMIGALRTFDLIFMTTRGGPGYATNVPALEVYNRAFFAGQVGSASALAVTLTVLIMVLAFLAIRLGEEKDG